MKFLSIIKCTIFLLFFSTVVMGAGDLTYSQSTNLTIQLKNVSVKDVFREIESKSEFIFIFRDDIVDLDRKISLNVKNKNIHYILNEIFNSTDNRYEVIDRQVVIMKKEPSVVSSIPDAVVIQQGVTITGTVTDATGEPLPGVNVVEKGTTIGVYYFDGWSGQNRHTVPDGKWADEPWAKNAPTHLTKRFVEEFPGREPVWGWRNDTQEIMERQIDLAADHGIDFFLFCWYWKDNAGPINVEAIMNDSKHTSMELYLKAKNKHRIKFSLLIANHQGFDIQGAENWGQATEFWMLYFKDPQYVTVDGKPLIVLFGSRGIDNDGLAAMQEVAKKRGLKNGLAIAGCGGNKVTGGKNFTHSTHYNVVPGYADGSEEHKFDELVDATKAQWIGTEQQPYIPLLTAGWDKRPWEGPDGLGQKEGWYFPDSSPEKFKSFLKDAIQWMDDNPKNTTKERLVLIYAWNENGEGGYLMPTKGDPGAGKLKMIKEVVEGK